MQQLKTYSSLTAATQDQRLSSDQAVAQERQRPWGRAPELSLIAASGLVLVAIAHRGGWEDAAWAPMLRWIGLLVLFVPIALRLFSSDLTRRERIGLLCGLGLLLYLVRVLYSPLEFKFGDELQQWRSAANIMESGHLFQPNLILLISPFYPGLQNVTTALAHLSGLPLFESGVIVLGVIRLVQVVALYLVYERVSNSSTIAALASLFYMTNPHFQSFAAMFVYQAPALALASLVLYIETRLTTTTRLRSWGLRVALFLSLAAVVTTHHITSYVLVLIFISCTGIAVFLRRTQPDQRVPLGTTLVLLGMILLWMGYVATETIDYLAPTWTQAASEILRLISLDLQAQTVFRAPAGPVQEQLLSYASVGLISIGILLGLRPTWRQYRRNALALTLALVALAYLASIGFRLVSSQGAELTGRSWSFTFLGVSFVLAIVVVELKQRWQGLRKSWLLPIVPVVIFAGGIVAGLPPYWGRLPGPYLAAADERSIEPQGVAAANWAGQKLGPFNRMATDFTNFLLMGAYGKQAPDTALSTVFMSPQIGPEEQQLLRNYDIRYLVVDKRLSTALPAKGYYFSRHEPQVYEHTQPISIQALTKFDDLADVNRLFDSGDLIIYDVRQLFGAR